MNKRILTVTVENDHIVVKNDGNVVFKIPQQGKKEIKGDDMLSILDYHVSDQYEVLALEDGSKNPAAESLHSLLRDIAEKINKLVFKAPEPNEPAPTIA